MSSPKRRPAVTLAFPPPFDISQPYLSLPTLTGYLRRAGISVTQRDLNIEFYNYILSRSFLTSVLEDLQSAMEKGRDPEGRVRRACALLPFLIDNVEAAKRRIRHPNVFLDPFAYSRDIRILHRSCDAISALYYPSQITLSTFLMRYRVSSIDEILSASRDARENPLLPFMRRGAAASLVNGQPKFIGLSIVYSHQLIPALTIAREVKHLCDIPIIAGGEVISRMVRSHEGRLGRLMDFLDAAILDDGSDTLVKIFEDLSRDGEIRPTDNVITKEKGENFRRHPAALPSLDFLGRPDFTGLPLGSYIAPGPILPILSGKGCQWGECVFCTESFAKSFATRSLAALLDDVEYLMQAYGCRHFTFADSDIPPTRLQELADGVLQRGLKIFWSCYARLTPRMTPSLIQDLALAGCKQIYFGLETSSQRLLTRMKKGINIRHVPGLLQVCHDHGIFTHLFCFVGFPGETEKEAWGTAKFLEDHLKLFGSCNIGAFSFRTFSQIYQRAEKHGITAHLDLRSDGDIDHHDYQVEEGLTMEEAEPLARKLIMHLSATMRHAGIPHTCYATSGYIIKGNVPAWQSHSIYYLAHRLRSIDPVSVIEHDVDPSWGDYHINNATSIILTTDCDSQTVFCTRSARILRLTRTEQLSSLLPCQ